MNFLKLSKFFLYLVPFSVIFVSRSTLFPFIVGKYVFFRVVVELALISFAWAWARGEIQFKEVRPPKINGQHRGGRTSQILKSPLVIAVSVFVLIFLLAGFFGYNPSASFWSNFERGEGGLQILHLYIFFILSVLLFRDEKAWRKMFVVSLWAAGLVIIYGLAAALGLKNFIGGNICQRFSGSLGNSAYIGTFMIFALFYAAYLFAIEYQHKSAFNQHKSVPFKKWFWIGLSVVFFVFLVLSQTRGALLGFGVAIIGGLCYFFCRLPAGRIRKLVLVAIIILIILGGLAFKFRRSIVLMPFCRNQGGGNRILDIDFRTENFQTRLLLWKQAIKIFQERPILGWGPENFSLALEKHYLPQFEVWYDRAHNIFFDYLTQTGILGLLSYLGIFAVFYWQFFKRTRNYAEGNAELRGKSQRQPALSPLESALLFALPIAFLVQGIVLFEVLPVYINLFLFLAFSSWIFHKQTLNPKL